MLLNPSILDEYWRLFVDNYYIYSHPTQSVQSCIDYLQLMPWHKDTWTQEQTFISISEEIFEITGVL